MSGQLGSDLGGERESDDINGLKYGVKGNWAVSSFFPRCIAFFPGLDHQTKYIHGYPNLKRLIVGDRISQYVVVLLSHNDRHRHFSGKPFDISNLMNPTGKEFDQQTSSVLAMIQQNGSAATPAAGGTGPPRSLLQNV